MGKMYTRFQNKTAQKNHPDGAAHTYVAYIREYLPPPGGGGGEHILDSRDLYVFGNMILYPRATHALL